jgi:endonuclease/exonuclease/phosphatase family metal-dependent hydrolase
MAMKNRYARRSRISEAKIREVVRYFAADLTALQAARLSGLNRNTINRLYRALRERVHTACEAQRPLFGIFERDGMVCTEIVPDCSKATLQGIIRGKGRRGDSHQLRWLEGL